MANDNGRDGRNEREEKEVIYDSETNRDVRHRADGTKDVVEERTERVTEVREEPKRKSPLPWLIPLLLLLIAIPLLMGLCDNKDDNKVEDTKTEETTEEATTEEATTEETTEEATTEEATTEDVMTEEATTEEITTEEVTTEAS